MFDRTEVREPKSRDTARAELRLAPTHPRYLVSFPTGPYLFVFILSSSSSGIFSVPVSELRVQSLPILCLAPSLITLDVVDPASW